jgi:hypothetical protein
MSQDELGESPLVSQCTGWSTGRRLRGLLGSAGQAFAVGQLAPVAVVVTLLDGVHYMKDDTSARSPLGRSRRRPLKQRTQTATTTRTSRLLDMHRQSSLTGGEPMASITGIGRQLAAGLEVHGEGDIRTRQSAVRDAHAQLFFFF